MKSPYLAFLLLCGLLLSACGSPAPTPAAPTPDVAAVRTSAASTVVSQFTLTAAAFTPTPPPPSTEAATEGPTATSTGIPVAQVTNAQGTPIVLCDKYSWDSATVDVNIPDNTILSPGQDFTKTWKIKNVGSCTWGDGYKLVFRYGEKMAGEAQPLTGPVAPGQEVDVSVKFKAPTGVGKYLSSWTMQNAKGIPFLGNDNKSPYVQIIVQ